jgi:hypothetical protein
MTFQGNTPFGSSRAIIAGSLKIGQIKSARLGRKEFWKQILDFVYQCRKFRRINPEDLYG